MKNIPFLCLLLFLTACSKYETVKTKNDEGKVTEEYQIDKTTKGKTGIYKAYDDQGRLTELANYQNDTLQGERIVYFENGNIQVKENYESGKFSGVWQGFYDNNQLEIEGKYVNNEMVGVWKRFYPTGQLMEEVTFAKNSENGPFVEFYENGNLKAKGNYLEGDYEHGELKLYNEEGELERKMECKKGRCVTIWKSEKLAAQEKLETDQYE